MARVAVGLLVLLCGVVVLASAQAEDGAYDSSIEAADAAFHELLPEWNVTGECNTAVTPEPEDVCYRFTPGRSTASYLIYSAFPFRVTDVAWWVGIERKDDGWTAYDGGRCGFFYCRMAAPDDQILLGYPTGNVDCMNGTTSEDALLILQFAAGLLTHSDLQCLEENGNVSPGGAFDSLDALAILQSDAGLITGLPLRGEPQLP